MPSKLFTNCVSGFNESINEKSSYITPIFAVERQDKINSENERLFYQMKNIISKGSTYN